MGFQEFWGREFSASEPLSLKAAQQSPSTAPFSVRSQGLEALSAGLSGHRSCRAGRVAAEAAAPEVQSS